nr:MAG TPA: hypothetical protein [Caudoviricetes sp.]
MKYVILYFDINLQASVDIYISLETLNKIKKGEYKYPFIQYTDGKNTFLERLDNIFTLKVLDDKTKTFDELENKMYKYMQLNKAYEFNILVDEQNGF